MASIPLSAAERNAIFLHVRADLLAIDDLRLAIEAGEFDTVDRLARRYAGELRLVLSGLDWKEFVADPVEIALPVTELRATLTALRDRASEQYKAAEPEQAAFRAPWERAALVRNACDNGLARLDSA